MLDVSIRAGVLNLMEEMKFERQMSLLYITHDIATARYIAEDLAVMYVGHMVEWGDTDEIIHDPQHPYTKLLVSAVPDPKSRSTKIGRQQRRDPTVDSEFCRLPICRTLFVRFREMSRSLARSHSVV